MNAVDTNVLIYACDGRDEALQNRALSVLDELRDGVLLWQVACEFIAASRKLVEHGFTPEAAWDRLGTLQRLFPIVVPSLEVLRRARELHTCRQVSFWDATILAACVEAGVNRLFSQDVPGSVVEGVQVINPFA